MSGGPRNFTEVAWRVAEKQEQAAAERMMTLLGFSTIRFSQPRNTMQTPGIADDFFVHPTRKLSVWYESKRVGGKQSRAQRAFQELIESSGGHYVVGPCRILADWCVAQCLAHRTANGNLIALRAS